MAMRRFIFLVYLHVLWETNGLLAEMRAELARVGANLNQVAKKLNSGLYVEQSAISDVVNAVDEALLYINQLLRP